jgi:hypothetical protein
LRKCASLRWRTCSLLKMTMMGSVPARMVTRVAS